MEEVTSEDFEPDAQLLKCLLFSLQPSKTKECCQESYWAAGPYSASKYFQWWLDSMELAQHFFPIAIQDDSTANDVGFPHAKTCDGACLPWGSLLPEA